jgi:hypothetical protein
MWERSLFHDSSGTHNSDTAGNRIGACGGFDATASQAVTRSARSRSRKRRDLDSAWPSLSDFGSAAPPTIGQPLSAHWTEMV